MGDNFRRELSIKLEKHTNQFSKRSKELKTAQNDGTLMEIDLLQLSNKFNKLKSYILSPPTIDFQDTMIIFKPIICAMHTGLNGYSCDFQLHDIIELLLDCDHQIIRLTNKRTHSTHMMKIDLVKCPFPWYFLLNLFYRNDRVRILYIDIVNKLYLSKEFLIE